MLGGNQSAMAEWQFTDVSAEAGAAHLHGYIDNTDPGVKMMAGGVAAGDYDNDGDIDLYLVTGDISENVLLNNNGQGGFDNVSNAAGAGLSGHISSGPVFADINGDGWLDLAVGGVAGSGYHVFINDRNGRFTEVTAQSGIYQQTARQNDYSSAFGDADQDGDLDLFVTHWGAEQPTNHLWLNNGSAEFLAADDLAGLDIYLQEDWSFSPCFTDINQDGLQDLLVTGDYQTSQVFINTGGGRFARITTPIIDDENGMGSAAADFDNDGDVDWFVTSIHDQPGNAPVWGVSGNRLYRNDGHGNFENVTDSAGVREGYWGWGACAADFNNDGWLDIFHVNGMPAYGNNPSYDFETDPSRLFVNDGDGSFTEASVDLGIEETAQGRGVVCFDYDNDGDVDIFSANYGAESRLLRNDLPNNPGYLQIRLRGTGANPFAVGSAIYLQAGGRQQYRQLSVGSNFESQNPLVQHFGLAGADTAEQIRVIWPDGRKTAVNRVPANQTITLTPYSDCPTADCGRRERLMQRRTDTGGIQRGSGPGG